MADDFPLYRYAESQRALSDSFIKRVNLRGKPKGESDRPQRVLLRKFLKRVHIFDEFPGHFGAGLGLRHSPPLFPARPGRRERWRAAAASRTIRRVIGPPVVHADNL